MTDATFDSIDLLFDADLPFDWDGFVAVATPVITPPTLAQLLAGDNQPCARLLSLDAAGNVRASWEATEGRMLSGDVGANKDQQVRRTGTITIANDAQGTYAPTQVGDWFFPGERLQVERGVIRGTTRLYVPLARLVVASCVVTEQGQITITGLDVLSDCDQSFDEVLSFDASTTPEDLVIACWGPVLGDTSLWQLDGGGQTIGSPRTSAESDNRLDFVMQLLSDLGLEAFADRTGNIVMRPVPDPTKQPIARSYVVAPGKSLMMPGLTRTMQARPFNRQIVVSSGPNQDTVRGQADVDDPASPIHSSVIGLHVAPYCTTSRALNQDQANTLARILLTRQAFRQDSVSVPMVPDVTLDEGDVVGFTGAVSRTNDAYWLATVDLPILEGTMQLQGPKAIPLFLDAA